MATNAFLGKGATLAIGDAGGPTGFVNIAELQSFAGLREETGEVEVTHLDSTVEEFIAGFPVVNNISGSVNWDPQNATHDESSGGLIGLVGTGETRYIRITWRRAGVVIKTATFTGFVRVWEVGDTSPKVAGTLNFEIRRSSEVTWANS